MKKIDDYNEITVNIWDDYKAQPEYDENETTYMYVEEHELNDSDKYNITKFLYGVVLMIIYENQNKYSDVDCEFFEYSKMNQLYGKIYNEYKVNLINFDYNKLKELYNDIKNMKLKYNNIDLLFISES